MELSFKEKYASIGKKGISYEGIFVTAVKTTGIFCRPSCRARKPDAKNVVFYNTPQEALLNGFRPCKICKPMEVNFETPETIRKLLVELQEDPYLRIRDHDLGKRGIEPNRVRRWFKKHHNMTFHAYQRMMRLNNAYNLIRNGNSVTDTAFTLGYESLSGFSERYQDIFGQSPGRSVTRNVINIVRFSTRLGPMFACASRKGLCLLEFTDRRMLETDFKDLCKKLDAVILPGRNKHLDIVQDQVKEYFDGKRQDFNIPLHTPGSEFQQSVWKTLRQIPYGHTWSYQEQADKMNKPKGVRAVASANGQNRISIIIPCHRVIGSNGDLTGYGGGLARKRWLLEMEQNNFPKTAGI